MKTGWGMLMLCVRFLQCVDIDAWVAAEISTCKRICLSNLQIFSSKIGGGGRPKGTLGEQVHEEKLLLNGNHSYYCYHIYCCCHCFSCTAFLLF